MSEKMPSVKSVINRCKKYSRARAVREYCFECAGGTALGVTLCNVLSCPLWFWRFGVPVTSKSARIRMEKCRKSHSQEWLEAFGNEEDKNEEDKDA